ncbi:MAG: dihydropteroate synthase [Eubacterium ventriosum]
MHNKNVITYNDFVNDVVNCNQSNLVEIAHKAGVKDSQIVLDPGSWFAKDDMNKNLLIIKHVGQTLELGYPVLLGTSRKSVIGLTLDVDKNDRTAGTECHQQLWTW